jgi:hypothetical protein
MKEKPTKIPGVKSGDKIPARKWAQFRIHPDLEAEVSSISERLFISRTDAISLLLGFSFRMIREGHPLIEAPSSPKNTPSEASGVVSGTL